jgi:phytoene dehydrogenase-like protein
MNYDSIIIGAGMSALAAGIRLQMFDKKVLILEKHSIPGGLNSYYQRKIPATGEVFEFDVGLHALTNFALKNEKGKPLTKLLKQLRISYDEFELKEQSSSLISFPNKKINIKNRFEDFENEIQKTFPHEIQNFKNFDQMISAFNETNLEQGYQSAKAVLRTYFQDPLLIEMLMAPLMIYGSAWEDDMDFSQFAIMYKAIYKEGFSRPVNGVRTIINILTQKFLNLGGEILYKKPVTKILTENKKAIGVELQDGSHLLANCIFSSIGLPETFNLNDKIMAHQPPVGSLSFMECLFVLDKKIKNSDCPHTIIFHNNTEVYQYKKAHDYFDSQSAVLCLTDNFQETKGSRGIVRVTFMANYELWKSLSSQKEEYKNKKQEAAKVAYSLISKYINNFSQYEILFTDIFTPTTIEKFTWRRNGAVYGSPEKIKDGRTELENLYIIGTDQGFLGVIGSMLSGISMANLHGLQGSQNVI